MNYNSAPNWVQVQQLISPGGMQIWQWSRSHVKRGNVSWNYRHVITWDQKCQNERRDLKGGRFLTELKSCLLFVTWIKRMKSKRWNFSFVPHRSPCYPSRNLFSRPKNAQRFSSTFLIQIWIHSKGIFFCTHSSCTNGEKSSRKPCERVWVRLKVLKRNVLHGQLR